MSPPQEPSRWRATWTQIERHHVPENTSPDFENESSWSEPFRERLRRVQKALIPIMTGAFFSIFGICLFLKLWTDTEEEFQRISLEVVHLHILITGVLAFFFISWGLETIADPFWSTIHGFAKALRLIKPKPAVMMDVDVTFEVPLQLEMSWARDHPTLQWTASQAIALHGDPLSQDELDALETQLSMEGGLLDIAPGQVAVDLSVDPNNSQILCLELRSTRDKTRLHIALRPSDLQDAHQNQALPKITRHGLTMETQDRAELLQQLALAAQIQGITLPSRLQQQSAPQLSRTTQR